MTADHVSIGGSDFISAGMNNGDHDLGYGEYTGCSDCHSTANLAPLHANNCLACHGSAAPDAVKSAIANKVTDCTACHASQHAGENGDHEDIYNNGCDCHDIASWDYPEGSCTACHPASAPSPRPSTTSDAKASYIGDAVINLYPNDNVNGTFGIKATYYSLDGAAAAVGTQIAVPATGGTDTHTLRFWSTDWSGNTEATNTAQFTVAPDTFPPTTTSDIVPGKVYAGDQTFKLTATDANSAVAGTWWQLDGTGGAWTSGTSVPVTAPSSGTLSHTLYWYSRDSKGNTEAVKSAGFQILAGKDLGYTRADQSFVVPSGVTTIAVTMTGGSGGNSVYTGGTYSLGGRGGKVTAVVPVTPGTTLTVRVASAGSACSIWGSYGAAGWPNGGSGNYYGGGGGGSTSIWSGTTELAEAGGGGGGGSSTSFGAGGAGGAQGSLPGGYKTGPAATSYGAGGAGAGWNAGAAGPGTYRGGTGGTSYIASGTGTLISGDNLGNGSVTIRYSAPGPDTAPPVTTSNVTSGFTYNGSQVFALSATDSGSGVAGTWWQLDSTTGPWTSGVSVPVSAPSSGIAPHTLYWYSRDTSGNVETTRSVSFSVSVLVDTIAPTGSVVIDSGAAATNSTAATLTLSASDTGGSGLSQMRFSNDGSSWSGWEAYATSKTWTLSGGDGTKKVYVQYEDAAGNASSSASDTIVLDTVAPVTTNTAIEGTAYTDAQTFTLSASDTGGSGVAGTWYQLDGGALTAGTSISVPAPSTGTVSHTITWYSKDAAGNQETTKTVSFTVAALVGAVQTTSLNLADYAWFDAKIGSSSPWAEYRIYVNDVLVGTKPADGTTTWNCPQVATPSGGHIDVVMDCGFNNYDWYWDYNVPVTYTLTLPAGTTRVEASTWSGFQAMQWGDDYYDGYGDDYTGVWIAPSTITGIKSFGPADTTPPTTTSNATTTYTGPATITLTGTDNTGGWGVASTYYILDGAPQQTGTVVSVPAPATGSVAHTLEFWSVDKAGNIEFPHKTAAFTVAAPPDTTPPSGTMSVNAGSASTSSTAATVDSAVTDAGSGMSDMRIDPGTGTFGSWIAYAARSPIGMSAGDGTKSVRVQYRDVIGNVLTLTDTIVLDTTAPTGSVAVNNGAVSTTSTAATLTLGATDAGGTGVYQMRVSNDGSTWSAWAPYSTSKAWTLDSALGTKTVYVQFSDNTGNVSGSFSDTIQLVDTTPPTTTSSYNPAAGAVVKAAQPVTLSPTDNVGGSGVATTYYRIDSGTWNAGTSFTVTGDGLHTFSYYSVDVAGNTETTRTSNSFRIDTVAPVTTNTAIEGTAYTDAQTFTLSASDTGGSGVAGTWYQLDGGALTAGTSISVPAPSTGTVSHTITWYSKDAAGNQETTKTVSFTVAALVGAVQTTSLNLADYAWFDAKIGSSSPWAEYRIYVNDVLVGTKPADGTTTWNCPQVATPSGGHIDVVMDCGFNNYDWYWDYNVPVTYTLTLPAGTTRVEASTWSGFQAMQWGDDYYDGYGDDYTGVWIAPSTITGIKSFGPADTTPPTTTSNATTTYTGPATITLTGTDNTGGWGVASTYYILDGAPQQTGTVVSVPAPATGSVAHTLEFWSVDKAGNIEFPHKTAAFTVAAPPDTTPPSGTMSVNAGSASTSSTAATVDSAVTDAGSGMSDMRIDPGTGTFGSWIAYAASSPIGMPAGDGTKSVRVQYRDVIGNVLTLTDTIVLDTTAPTGSVAVNNGATWTTSTSASVNSTVTDSGTGLSQMRVDPGSGTFGSWIAYSATSAITLPGGDGTKTVNVQYKDNAGNVTTLTDSIVLDTSGPTGVMSVNNGASETATYAVSVDSTVTDTVSGVSQMRVDPGTGTYGSWAAYAAHSAITLPSGEGTKTVNVQYKDNAGNVTTLSDGIVVLIPDVTPPTTTSNAAASYAGTATITLTAADDPGGSGVSATYYKVDGGAQTAGTSIVVSPPSTGSANHTIEFWSVDAKGNVESPHKTAGFSVAAVVVGNATLQFRWEPGNWSEAQLHVQNASGTTIASTSVNGYGSDLDWDVVVPAGQSYYLVCDYYYDGDSDTEGGGYGTWIDASTPNAGYTWWY